MEQLFSTMNECVDFNSWIKNQRRETEWQAKFLIRDYHRFVIGKSEDGKVRCEIYESSFTKDENDITYDVNGGTEYGIFGRELRSVVDGGVFHVNKDLIVKMQKFTRMMKGSCIPVEWGLFCWLLRENGQNMVSRQHAESGRVEGEGAKYGAVCSSKIDQS